jgi:acyl-coenzyme A synthetase/AMP-(fatty) acid ligase
MKQIISQEMTDDLIAPLSFQALLKRLSSAERYCDNEIGDALLQVSYAALPLYLASIDHYLQQQQITPDDCIAFECQNTTVAVIVLLALFYRGQHLLLLPPEGSALKEPNFKPSIPSFCKVHLTVSSFNSVTKQPDANELKPQDILALIHHYPHNDFSLKAFQRLGRSERLLMLRTSGSMGASKIVCFSHATLIANANRCVKRFGLKKTSRVTITVPVFHLYGLGAGFIPSLLAGASVDLQANSNILRFLAHERRFNPDTVYLNPTLSAMLLKSRRQDRRYAHSISAGARLPQDVEKEYHRRFGVISNLYGSSEMGVIATASSNRTNENSPHFIPLPGVKMTIKTEKNDALYCLHPNGFKGYINTQGEALPIENFPYNTGDRAESDHNGSFKLIGRQGNSANRSGFLVQFDDIEQALLGIAEVEQSIVMVSEEETLRGQKLYAFCVTKKTPHSTEMMIQLIRNACFACLPKYAVPDDIILKQTFPLSASGKVDRQALLQQII